MEEYDAIVIGAGSLGTPITFNLAKEGLKVLCVDALSAVGQGENKKAIGGVRATHSQKGKILTCLRSIEILKNWEKNYGENIEWYSGGYAFVAYDSTNAKMLQETVKLQKKLGLKIEWVDNQKVKEIIPGINENGLIGSTWSPDDGHVSPLLTVNAYYFHAKDYGAQFQFNEMVTDIFKENNKVIGIKTKKGTYYAPYVINAAGARANEIAELVGIKVPIMSELHEAGITEQVAHFLDPMVIDIRLKKNEQFGDSKNFYFCQNLLGQIIFCITPHPPIYGIETKETSNFLPQIAQRMVSLLPRLRNIKVRRVWRGIYPMTPDGNPIVGVIKNISGYINAIGMCGQGLMLGPGIGELITRLITNKLSKQDKDILDEFSLYRDFGTEEKLR